MFERKKKTGCQTPKFRKPTPPPLITGSNVQLKKEHCIYKTPCGWCTKWDKKCDKKMPKIPPCSQCHYNNWFLPYCIECGESNDFKNFKTAEYIQDEES